MGFTTPCIIRKNTTKIRDRLKELGYNCNPYLGWHNLYTSVFGFAAVYSMSDDDINVLSKKIDSFIDCGTNEELFLAIAALRDDTNENQWFTNGEEWAYHPKTECCSPCNTVYITLAFDSIPEDTNMGNYHKATVEELIEHFKEKEVNHG